MVNGGTYDDSRCDTILVPIYVVLCDDTPPGVREIRVNILFCVIVKIYTRVDVANIVTDCGSGGRQTSKFKTPVQPVNEETHLSA